MNAQLLSNDVSFAPACAGSAGLVARRSAAFVEAVHDRLLARFFLILITPLFLLQLAVYEWIQQWSTLQPHPVALTLMAGLVAGYAAHRIRPLWKRLHQATESDDSEWRINELMEYLPALGYRVLAKDSGSADESLHLVVGPSGIYSICVNTRRRPKHEGDAVEHRMREDGKESLVLAGSEVFGDPLGKVAKAAVHVEKRLLRQLGRVYAVQPLLVFPGWEVENPHGNGKVWVLNEDLLEGALAAQPGKLARPEIEQIHKALAGR